MKRNLFPQLVQAGIGISLLAVVLGVAVAQLTTFPEETAPVDTDLAWTADLSDTPGDRDRKIELGTLRKFLTKGVTLSQAGTLAAALTDIGSNGTILVDQNETLAAASYNIPRGVELTPLGGVLTMAAGTTINNKGSIRGPPVQLLDNAAGGTFNHQAQQQIHTSWFGMANVAEAGTSTANQNALVWALNAGKNTGATVFGASLILPAGEVTIDGGLEINDSAIKDLNIYGDSQRGTVLKLKTNANARAIYFNDLTKGGLYHWSIDGNVANQSSWPADTPLVEIQTWSTRLFDFHVRDSAGHGLLVNGSQDYSITNCSFQWCEGWNLILQGPLKATVEDCNVEAAGATSPTGGIWARGGADDVRQETTNICIHDIYAEACPIAVQFSGISGIHVSNVHLQSDSDTLYKLIDDPANGLPATFNVLDARGCRGVVDLAVGSINNKVITRPEGRIAIKEANLTGQNWIGCDPPVHVWQPGGDRSGSLVTSSNPVDWSADLGSGAVRTTTAGSILHPAANYVATTGPAHDQIVQGANQTQSRWWLDLTSSSGATYTIYAVFKLQLPTTQATPRVYFQIRNNTDGQWFSWREMTWEATTDVDEENLFLAWVNGQYVYAKATFPSPGASKTMRCHFAFSGEAVEMESHHLNVATTAELDVVHRRGGADVGFAGHVEYTNATRPTASEVPAGTTIYNSDDNAKNTSDGTNWRDSDGNTTQILSGQRYSLAV